MLDGLVGAIITAARSYGNRLVSSRNLPCVVLHLGCGRLVEFAPTSQQQGAVERPSIDAQELDAAPAVRKWPNGPLEVWGDLPDFASALNRRITVARLESAEGGIEGNCINIVLLGFGAIRIFHEMSLPMSLAVRLERCEECNV